MSVRLGPECHFDAPRYHLADVLWRVWLMDAATMAPVPLPDNGTIVMPIASDPATQNCVALPALGPAKGAPRGGYRSAPRSPISGYCTTGALGWVTVTAPHAFPAARGDGIPMALVVLVGAVVLLCGVLGCLAGLWLRRKEVPTHTHGGCVRALAPAASGRQRGGGEEQDSVLPRPRHT